MSTALSTLSTRLRNEIGDTEASFSSRYTQVLNDAGRELYPLLHRIKKYQTLVTGNVLPNSHSEDWAATTIPDFYTAATGGCTEETTTIRGPRGTSACKVTASGANDKMYITSTDWPPLLDLMGKTVTFKAWAYPEVADDGYIEIYTIQADGTEQTLTSTTTCPALKWTLLKLENQSINDDIVEIQFRYKVATTTKYVIFDNSRAIGPTVREYLLPTDFQTGEVDNVGIQTSSSQDDPCDDLGLYGNFKPIDFNVVSDGTYKYLRTAYQPSEYTLEVSGKMPLEDDLDENTDTISIDDPETNILVVYAAYLLYERMGAEISSDSTIDSVVQAEKFLKKYYRLKHKISDRSGLERLRLPRP